MGHELMPTLHLGVVEIPYSSLAKGKKAKAAMGAETTGDVAGWLENKYHIMEFFFGRHEADIAAVLEDGMAGSLESLLMGAPVSANPFGTAEGQIDKMFRRFLDREEMAGQLGVPTQAALNGVSHRKKHPYASRNARRPSFIDTGLYQASFKSWVENK
jgi:hypothetical protein